MRLWFVHGGDLAMDVVVQTVPRCIGPFDQIGVRELRPILRDPAFALCRGVYLNTCSSGSKDQEKNQSKRNTTHRDNPEPGVLDFSPAKLIYLWVMQSGSQKVKRPVLCRKWCAICVKRDD
jgi:hypothetical protein